MRVLDRLASLTAADIRIDHVPLQRSRPDDRDLDHDVREIARPHARERLRLRATLHLEETDRVDLADEVVHRGIVERQRSELEKLPVQPTEYSPPVTLMAAPLAITAVRERLIAAIPR